MTGRFDLQSIAYEAEIVRALLVASVAAEVITCRVAILALPGPQTSQ